MCVVNGKDVAAAILAQTLKGKKNLAVTVGYEAPYAVYVHENLVCNHPNGGQAKYLEQPARTEAKKMQSMIHEDLGQKKGLEYALMRAGKYLLRKSQELVPIDTGFLHDSGYVRVEEGE